MKFCRISLIFIIFHGLIATEGKWQEGVPDICSMAIEATTEELSQRESKSLELAPQIKLYLRPNAPIAEENGEILPEIKKDEDAFFRQLPFEQNEEDHSLLPSSDLRSSLASPPNFTAVTYSEAINFPPDSNGAVGPTQYIALINGRIKSFNKTTGIPDGILNFHSSAFFSPVLRSGFRTSDPRIRYDRFTNRWYLAMLGFTNARTADDVLIAISDTGNISPNTVWKFFAFTPATVNPPRSNPNDFADFPTLGIDVNAVYIGVDIYRQSLYNSSDIFVINKLNLLKGMLQVTTFRNIQANFGPITPQAVDNFDHDATEGYFIGVPEGIKGYLALVRVANPGGIPKISFNTFIPIPSIANPFAIPHKGNTTGSGGNLDGIDLRLSHAHIRDKHLYAAQNLRVDATGFSDLVEEATAVGSRFYEIDLTNSDLPELIQSPTLYGPGTSRAFRRSYWVPSIMTNGLHNIVMGFSTAGQPYYVDAGYIQQFATDPRGSLPNSAVLYTQSSTSYNPPNDPGSSFGRRWGDYSTTSVDPMDNMTLWTIQEFCYATNIWGCQVVSILAPRPPRFTIAPTLVSPSSSVDLIVTGTSVKGAAFYDPPADFPKHLQVTLGDCKINSVQVLSPTKLKVNVSTLGTKGNKIMQVTNPDGQIATSMNVVTVRKMP